MRPSIASVNRTSTQGFKLVRLSMSGRFSALTTVSIETTSPDPDTTFTAKHHKISIFKLSKMSNLRRSLHRSHPHQPPTLLLSHIPDKSLKSESEASLSESAQDLVPLRHMPNVRVRLCKRTRPSTIRAISRWRRASLEVSSSVCAPPAATATTLMPVIAEMIRGNLSS